MEDVLSVVSTAAAGILAVVALGFAYLAFLWIRAQIVRGTSQRTRRKRRSGPLERARDSARWETEVTAMDMQETRQRRGRGRGGLGEGSTMDCGPWSCSVQRSVQRSVQPR